MEQQLFNEEFMNQCHVCGSTEISEKIINHVFDINGKVILVENVPSCVCEQCGETTFHVHVVERIRQKLVDNQPLKTVEVSALSY